MCLTFLEMPSSKLSLRFVLCLQIVLFAVAYASHGDSKRYCGARLTQMLQAVCKNIYAYRNNKRSGISIGSFSINWTDENYFLHLKYYFNFPDDFEDNEYVSDEPITYSRLAYRPYPFVKQFDSTSALGMRVRRSDRTVLIGGIYEECCINPCSHMQLLSYCGI